MKPPKHIMLYGGILFFIVDPVLNKSMNERRRRINHKLSF